ncbi:MAG: hypothetical protein HY867_10440 [Chloroflexi bacterium]|nr:hypothetical protein [Chloroflexota bacterium]
MKLEQKHAKTFGVISVMVLLTLTVAACGGAAFVAPVNDGMISICHATGDPANPYNAIALDFNELAAHANHVDDLVPAPANGCPQVVAETGSNNGRITICHATGSLTNPYNEITIAFNGLNGHSNHEGDVIPAPEGGCPSVTATPAITATHTMTATPTPTVTPGGTGMITICHATGSAKNPYVLITVSVNGLNGHGDHAGDIIPVPDDGCPTQ